MLPRGFDKDCEDLTIEIAITSYAQAFVIKVVSQGTDKVSKDLALDIAVRSYA